MTGTDSFWTLEMANAPVLINWLFDMITCAFALSIWMALPPFPAKILLRTTLYSERSLLVDGIILLLVLISIPPLALGTIAPLVSMPTLLPSTIRVSDPLSKRPQSTELPTITLSFTVG